MLVTRGELTIRLLLETVMVFGQRGIRFVPGGPTPGEACG